MYVIAIPELHMILWERILGIVMVGHLNFQMWHFVASLGNYKLDEAMQ